MAAGVYEIRNAISGERYIGSSLHVEDRSRQHFGALRRRDHHCVKLQKAYDSFGKDVFEFKIIEIVDDMLFLLPREQFTIWRLRPEYNGNLDAKSFAGRKHTEISREKMSAKRSGRKLSKEWREAIGRSHIGRIKSPEECAAISAGLKGKKKSKEHRAKLSLAKKGKPFSAAFIHGRLAMVKRRGY